MTVVSDRQSRNAKASEEWVMKTLRRRKYGDPAETNTESTDNDNRIHDSETTLERHPQVVRAFIEL